MSCVVVAPGLTSGMSAGIWRCIMSGGTGVSFWIKNSPEICRSVPNVSCAAEIWLSTLGLARIPSRMIVNAVTLSDPRYFSALTLFMGLSKTVSEFSQFFSKFH